MSTSEQVFVTADGKPNSSRGITQYLPRFYAELRRLARARLAAGGRSTLLDTTVLVHESFLRLQRADNLPVNDDEHFLAYAARSMRSVVVDYARRRKAERRGGGAAHTSLKTAHAEEIGVSDDEILEVNEALGVLAAVDTRLAQVIEMRYFGGLTDVEIGKTLGVTDRTVRRDWERARLLLAGLLGR
jgi:RNA polymerase sigma factor (TIGR02999 family)